MSKRLITPVLLLAVIIATVAGYRYWQSRQQQGTPAPLPPAVIADTGVVQEYWQPSLQSVGTLVAVNGINVSTEVNGIVSNIVFESGQAIEQGQVLIRLDDSVDTAALEALRAERRLTEVQFNRASDLLKKNVTSKSDFDEAQARFDAASARVKQQQAVIERKVIRAPFSGLAGIRRIDLGQFIEAGDPVVSLLALDPVYVDYTLPERYMSRIKTGQQVKLQLDAVPDRVFSGNISAINPGIDAGTRTLQVRASLNNADGTLRSGMFAQVVSVTGEATPVMTLPRTAISFNTYGNFVFVINSDTETSLVKRTAVTTGETRSGRVAVSGLSVGTRVVRTGLVKLRDGMAVKIDNSVELNDAEIQGE